MALMEWKEDYSVGIKHIDEQHMGLINQFNKLHDAMKMGRGKSILGDILTTLIQYTQTHFESEEALFDKFGYPETNEHKKEHQKFRTEVLQFKESFEEGLLMVTIELMNFLKNWLVDHMLGTDAKYKEFLSDKVS